MSSAIPLPHDRTAVSTYASAFLPCLRLPAPIAHCLAAAPTTTRSALLRGTRPHKYANSAIARIAHTREYPHPRNCSSLNVARTTYNLATHSCEGNFAILAINEELRHKIRISHDVLQTRQDLSRVLQGLFAEASAQVETRVAERKLAASREKEARHRQECFGRLIEVTKDEVLQAEMQAALLRLQARKAGLEQDEPAHLGEDNDADISITLD
ncbi:hypothetical protein MSAN_02331400 [Mycena sanguinolenta]|uniref:Uncharacterized protein n=1 Tax=Mycena sanguinolenta TaxID=230812 RepID=A0A8H6X7W6_9AGAR|nr:hypothetical protein MSAN_02331400 [Mycena sanguinolenta]